MLRACRRNRSAIFCEVFSLQKQHQTTEKSRLGPDDEIAVRAAIARLAAAAREYDHRGGRSLSWRSIKAGAWPSARSAPMIAGPSRSPSKR